MVQAVGHISGCAGSAKHYGVTRAERNGVARETGDEDADDEGIANQRPRNFGMLGGPLDTWSETRPVPA